MRTAKILAAFVLLVAFGAVSVFADFGGSISNESSVTKKDETDFLQEDTFSLWFSAHGETYRFDAALRATVSTDTPKFYADIEKLSVSGSFPPSELNPSLFTFELGRFYQSDFTTLVLGQTIDGLRFGFAFPSTNLKLSMGYTGFVNKHYNTILMSRLDAIDSADDDKIFASPRFLGSISWEFPELLARQTLTFSAIFQEDMRHVVDSDGLINEGDEIFNPTTGGRVDTQYWGVGLSGPVISSLYYDLFFYVGTGRMLTFENDSQSTTGQAYQYEKIFAYLAGGSIRYYMPSFLQSAAMVKFLYASGDKDSVSYLEGNTKGASNAFVPIADGAFGIAFVPKASNIMLAEFSYSLKPLSFLGNSFLGSLQAVGKVTPFFKPAKGGISESEVDPSSDSGYLGTEVDGVLNLRPFSDLGLSLSLGLFLPKSSMFVADMDSPWFVGKFLFSFSY